MKCLLFFRTDSHKLLSLPLAITLNATSLNPFNIIQYYLNSSTWNLLNEVLSNLYNSIKKINFSYILKSAKN